MRRLLFIFLTLLPLSAFAQSAAEFRAALVAHEGYSLTPYRVNGQGAWHIGLGHRLLPGEPRRAWTVDQVEQVYAVDFAHAYSAAILEVSSYPDQPREVQVILVELAFQCGRQGLHDFVRFRAAIDRKAYLTAAQELRDSRFARQTPGRARDHVFVLTRLSLRLSSAP